MSIDFAEIPAQTIPNFKGGLKEISCQPFAAEVRGDDRALYALPA